MDPQPAFLNRAPFEPLAGPGALQPGDPQIAIPGGVLQPDPPDVDRLDDNADAQVQPAPAEPDHANEAAGSPQKWSLAFGASLLFHAAVAAMLIFAPESILPPRPLSGSMQGGNGQDAARIGNSETPSISGGRQQADVTDVTVVPENELPPAKEARPKQEPVSQPTERPEKVAKQTREPEQQKLVEPAPEILHDRQVQPEKGAVAPQEMAPKATLEIQRPLMPEPSEAERELTEQQATPTRRPERAKSTPGANGQAQLDAMRGASDGHEDGKATSSGNQREQTTTGNAVASGYEALIQRKLVQANRQISRTIQAQATRNAWISFIVNADGSVTDIKLDRSSGSQALDSFAVAMVKKLAPFPPIPPETGRRQWLQEFSLGPF